MKYRKVNLHDLYIADLEEEKISKHPKLSSYYVAVKSVIKNYFEAAHTIRSHLVAGSGNKKRSPDQ